MYWQFEITFNSTGNKIFILKRKNTWTLGQILIQQSKQDFLGATSKMKIATANVTSIRRIVFCFYFFIMFS